MRGDKGYIDVTRLLLRTRAASYTAIITADILRSAVSDAFIRLGSPSPQDSSLAIMSQPKAHRQFFQPETRSHLRQHPFCALRNRTVHHC